MLKRWSQNDSWIACVSIAISITLLGWLLWYCRFGFDFTDEGFYLNWISNPFNYAESSTQFGFIYHPIYLLLDGSIANLRQLNLVFTYCLACIAGWALLGKLFESEGLNFLHRAAIAAALATSAMVSVVFSGMWLPTPSYNTLAFQGVLVATIGLFLVEPYKHSNLLAWILIGVGGWLTFMGKPTSAVAFAVTATAYLLISRIFRLRYVAITLGIALSLFVLTAFLIDGSIVAFATRLEEGALLAKVLDNDYTLRRIVRLEDLVLERKLAVALLILAASVFGAMWIVILDIKAFRKYIPFVSAAISALGVLAAFNLFQMAQIRPENRSLLIFAIPLGVVFAGILAHLSTKGSQKKDFHWPLMVTLLILPYVYAFGTGNNYWTLIGSACLFVIFSGLLTLWPLAAHPRLGTILLVVGFTVQAVAFVLLRQGLNSPYRQPQPLYKNDVPTDVGKFGAMLVMSNIHARYLASAMNVAEKSGFVRGTPVIDLTGRSPGVVYALGASSVGAAWMLGGYPGTSDFVSRALKSVPCKQLVSAWVLTEPQGSQAVPFDVLKVFGADLANDYQLVGRLEAPEGRSQYLNKPDREPNEFLQACKAAIGERR